MKIRHVISMNGRLPRNPIAEPASGIVGAALSLGQLQTEAGGEVEIWGWNDTQRPQGTLWNEINLWTSPEWSWARFARWDLSWLAPIWRHAITKKAVDVLHAHVDPNLLYLPRARIRLLHLHTPIPEPFPASYLRLLQRANAVICCSNFIRKNFLAASGYPAERTFVVHNGANLNSYNPAERRTQRDQWGLTENDFVILYTGAIVPEKGVTHLVAAFRRIQASFPNASLVIVGGAKLWAKPGGYPIADDYEEEVRRLAQGFNVRFMGKLPRGQMSAAYLAADIVVVPSVWDDPHPTVVCEAMAAGKPVVASRVGGITETVIHERTGFLVSPGDEAQLFEAIVTLATQEQLRQQMGQEAREHAKEFSWEASANRLDNIYQDLLMQQVNGSPS